jgi:pimeloyl-ACP methyl ester carboxylesterase
MFNKLFGNLEEGSVKIGSSEVEYAAFGRGETSLVAIPGLSEGLRTIKGTGKMLWFMYRGFARTHRIYVIGRKNELEEGYTTNDMADDLAAVMDKLDIVPAQVMGISQGGMIAQWLAINYPEKVSRLAILISLARQNDTVQQTLGNWIKMAGEEEYEDLAIDMQEKNFTEDYLKKMRPFYWILKRTGHPQSKERFLIQAESCRTHDAYDELSKIKCPTFIIGGGADKIVGGAEVQQEMAEVIKGSKLHIYPDLGHGAFIEAKDFNDHLYNFFNIEKQEPMVVSGG